MDIVYVFFFFVIGLVFGSFYNVVGIRVPKKLSIVTPGSHCPSCQRNLTATDLIPVLSYLILRGKCRSCKAEISPLYASMELITGLLFAFAYWRIGMSVELIVALLFISLIIIITVSDMMYMLIPNKILLFFFPPLLIGRMLEPLDPWWDSMLGAGIGFGVLLLLAVVSKGGMGGGDIKLFLLIGIVLGTIQSLLTLFIAAVIGLIGGIMILRVRNQGRKTPIPFGPFIAFAAIIVYFFGDVMVNWYTSLV